MRHGRWRAVVSAVCIVVATVTVPVSIVGGWARVQLVDEARFAATFAPLAADPAVQDLLVAQATAAVDRQVDFDALTGQVIDGITQLGLPPAAARALGLLQGPAADGLRELVHTGVERAVTSDAFSHTWAGLVTAAHRVVTTTATSDGGGVVRATPKGLVIELEPLVAQIAQRMTAEGIRAAALIPTVHGSVLVADGGAVQTVRTVYALAVGLGTWLPWVTLALLGAGVLLARRRATAVLGGGIGLAVAGAATVVALAVGRSTAGGAASAHVSGSAQAVDDVYTQVVAAMAQTAWILVAIGVLTAALAVTARRLQRRRALRDAVGAEEPPTPTR